MTERSRNPDFRFGIFELRTNERQLLAAGEEIVVGPRAFDLLVALVERSGELVTKDELLDRVWQGLVVEENNLQVQVSALRKILGQGAIATVPGRGYRFTGRSTAATRIGPSTAQSPGDTASFAPIDEGAPSIAVLPFVNMSDDAANEYFADGVAEELLNVLSKIRGLRVASRTSAFSFKGTKADIPAVAQRLGVATVLEGSVRKAGNRVRIAAQLVNAATDSHLWSQTYDRELEDIFAVQDDIAQSVVKELRSVLLREQRDSSTSALQAEVRAAAKRHSKNAEAYRLYLQGRFQVARRTREDVAKAIEYLQRATELDPEYALAWAAAAYAHTVAAFTGWIAREEGFVRARRAAERALALDPDLAEGHTALAHVRMDYEWDWTGADACSQRALDLAPGNAEVALNAAWAATPLGRLDESITLCRRAIALDPVNVQAHRYLGYFSLFAGLLEEAEAALKEALDLNPLGGFTHTHLGEVYLLQGRFPEALAEFEKESHAAMRLMGRSAANFALGRKAASSTALQELGQVPVNAFLNAQAHAYCGNVDPAFEWLERAYSQRDAGLCHMKLEPMLRNLHGESRWRAMVKKMGFAD